MATDENAQKLHPWAKEKVLGGGGFGIVTLWRNIDTGEAVALKKCRYGTAGLVSETMLTQKHVERWEKEVEIMNKLNHHAVVHCFSMPTELRSSEGSLPILCMEYCRGGDLRRVLNRSENCCGLKESVVIRCLSDISNALTYLHSLRIIHRDLKPENIVLQDVENQTVFKLIDLGYAKELDQNSVCASFVGTLQYLAPELFMSKRYTCTVDYWSFGLVTHEIITGVRPFLPNMTPVEWMKRINNKKSEHICVYEGRNGEIQFSSHIFPECYISPPLLSSIEKWLQTMLEWDSSLRGQVTGKDGKVQVAAFSVLQDLLSQKLLQYEVSEATTMDMVQELISADCGLDVCDQRLLLPRGQPPNSKRSAIQCWAPPDEEEWLLYVFSETIIRPHVTPCFPPLVEEMLRHPRNPVDYPTQRRMWAHAVFFLQREDRYLRQHMMAAHMQLTKTGQRLLSDIAKLQAKHNLFMESLNIDLDCYEEEAKSGRITSERLFGQWQEMGDVTLQLVRSVIEKVQQIETSLAALNTRICELQCSFNSSRSFENLSSEVSGGEGLYGELRRRSKEQRCQMQDNTEMCKQLLQALKKRDRLHQEFYRNIEAGCECLSEIASLSSPLEDLLGDIARVSQKISSLQKQRQKDIWKIMEIAITINHSRHVPELGVSHSSKSPNVQKLSSSVTLSALSALFEKSSKESDAIIKENRALRCQMVEMLSLACPTDLKIQPGYSPTENFRGLGNDLFNARDSEHSPLRSKSYETPL